MFKLAVVGVIVVVSFFSGYKVADVKWKTIAASAAIEHSIAVERIVLEHNATITKLEVLNEETRNKLSVIADAAVVADATSNKLQQQLDSISNTARDKAPTVNRECAAASTTVLVLTDVLRRADKRAGDLATTADQARVRGLACEAFYNTAVNSHH